MIARNKRRRAVYIIKHKKKVYKQGQKSMGWLKQNEENEHWPLLGHWKRRGRGDRISYQLTSMLICSSHFWFLVHHRCESCIDSLRQKNTRKQAIQFNFATFEFRPHNTTSSRREEVSFIWKGDRRATSNRRSDLRISQGPSPLTQSSVCKHCPEFADPPPDNHLDVRSNPYADSPIRPLLVDQVIVMVREISAFENGRVLARGRND